MSAPSKFNGLSRTIGLAAACAISALTSDAAMAGSVGMMHARIGSAGNVSGSSGVISAQVLSIGQYEIKFARDLTSCASTVTASTVGPAYATARAKAGSPDTLLVNTFNKLGVALTVPIQVNVICGP